METIRIENSFVEGKRCRKKSNYCKVNNESRQKLIEMVYLKDYLLKDAANELNINYSTAKTIMRIFRIERRIEKKSTDEDNDLRSYIRKGIHIQEEAKHELLSKNIELLNNESSKATNFRFALKDENQLDKTISCKFSHCSGKYVKDQKSEEAQTHTSQSHQIQTHSKVTFESLTENIMNLSKKFESCFEMVKTNQIIINNLLMNTPGLIQNNLQHSSQDNQGAHLLMFYLQQINSSNNP